MKTAKKDITAEKENGRIYTPDYIVNTILDYSGYKCSDILKKHVIDNSCGDGAFLKEIVKRYCDEAMNAGYSIDDIKQDLQTYIHGIEIDSEEHALCLSNLNEVANNYKIKDVSWDVLC